MTLNTFSAGVNTSFSSELNQNFAHSVGTGTSSVNFTPTDATTNVVIIAKGDITETGNASAVDFTVRINSDIDGTLDTVHIKLGDLQTSVNKNFAFSLLYTGNLSASAHVLTIVPTGTDIALANGKITVMEFI